VESALRTMNIQPMRDMMRWFDETLTRILQHQKQRGQSIQFTCSKGCFACCDEPLKVLEGEVDLILADMTPEEKEAIKPRVQAWVNAATASKLQPTTEMGKHDLTVNGKVINAFQYRALKLTCPLLKDGVCSVYANRPLGCRMHLAVGPRIKCEDLAQRPEQRFMTSPELDEAVIKNLISAHVLAGYTEIGVSHLGYFLACKLGLLKESE
jgi:Fe-S-cluster containining protein